MEFAFPEVQVTSAQLFVYNSCTTVDLYKKNQNSLLGKQLIQ